MRYTNKYAKPNCIKKNCTSKSYARSLCKRHYGHLKYHGREMNDEQLKVKRRTVNNYAVKEDHIEIHIKKHIVKIDNNIRLFSLIRRKKWCVGTNGYAVSGHTYLHDLIINKSKGMYIDHINREKLDNRITNLREVTPKQNTWNYTVRARSGHRGVHWDKANNKWRVHVARKNYGRYALLEDAIEVAEREREKAYGKDFT